MRARSIAGTTTKTGATTVGTSVAAVASSSRINNHDDVDDDEADNDEADDDEAVEDDADDDEAVEDEADDDEVDKCRDGVDDDENNNCAGFYGGDDEDDDDGENDDGYSPKIDNIDDEEGDNYILINGRMKIVHKIIHYNPHERSTDSNRFGIMKINDRIIDFTDDVHRWTLKSKGSQDCRPRVSLISLATTMKANANLLRLQKDRLLGG
jgi:hypothetical protein